MQEKPLLKSAIKEGQGAGSTAKPAALQRQCGQPECSASVSSCQARTRRANGAHDKTTNK
jgi:hypothetical protein